MTRRVRLTTPRAAIATDGVSWHGRVVPEGTVGVITGPCPTMPDRLHFVCESEQGNEHCPVTESDIEDIETDPREIHDGPDPEPVAEWTPREGQAATLTGPLNVWSDLSLIDGRLPAGTPVTVGRQVADGLWEITATVRMVGQVLAHEVRPIERRGQDQ